MLVKPQNMLILYSVSLIKSTYFLNKESLCDSLHVRGARRCNLQLHTRCITAEQNGKAKKGMG